MTGLDWRTHRVGDLRPCRHCRKGALMRDERGRPCHKTCAERADPDTPQNPVDTDAAVIPLPVAPVIDLTTRRRIA